MTNIRGYVMNNTIITYYTKHGRTYAYITRRTPRSSTVQDYTIDIPQWLQDAFNTNKQNNQLKEAN